MLIAVAVFLVAFLALSCLAGFWSVFESRASAIRRVARENEESRFYAILMRASVGESLSFRGKVYLVGANAPGEKK